MRYKYIIPFLFLLLSVCHAQNKKLHFEYLNMEHGLPENRITALLQDKKGYIWMGTQNGLVRYDGYTVKPYDLKTLGKIDFYYINCLFEDSKGVIWVGSDYLGLFRYDAVHDKFISADMGKGVDLKKKSIKMVTEDNRGHIWVIAKNENNETSADKERNNDLYKYNPSSKKTTVFNSKLQGKNKISASIFNIVTKDSNGNIWLGTDTGLFRYVQKQEKFVPVARNGNPDIKNISLIIESPTDKGILWLANKSYLKLGGGVTKFNTATSAIKNYSHSDGLGSDTIFSLYKDSQKRLWACTFRGLSLIDGKTGVIKNYVPEDSGMSNYGYGSTMFGMVETPDNNMWVVTLAGKLLFNSKTGKFIRYTPNNGNAQGLEHLSFNYDMSPLMDRSGTLYVPTIDMGLLRLNSQKSNYTFLKNDPENEKGYNGGTVWKITQGIDGIYWLATDKGLIKWDRKANTFENIPSKDDTERTWNVVLDKKNRVWYSLTAGGLNYYDPKTGAVKSFRNNPDDDKSIPEQGALALLCDSKDRIWLGTYGSGLCRYDEATDSFIRYPYTTREGNAPIKTDKLDDANVVTLNEDSKGNIWVGTNYGGLNVLNEKTGKFSAYNDASIGMMCMTSFYEGKDGIIWAGSYLHGLFRIDTKTGKIKSYRQEDGLLANNVHGIMGDDEGNLWIGSQRGISKFNPVTGKFSHLTKVNGLPDSQFLRAIFKDSNGEFFMPSKKGIVIFNPHDIGSNTIPPATHIESLSYPEHKNNRNDKTLYLTGNEKPELQHDQNRLTFNFVGIHYDNPALNTYRYKLKGYDDKWIGAGTQRSATYTNLSPGTYEFMVQSANPDGVWDKKGSSLVVTILPPWWRTWWAYTIYVILFAGVLRGYIVYRSHALKSKNRDLEEKVALRTQELNESLDSLKQTQNQLIQSEKMASLGELTAGIAHEIQNPLNFVNNFSDVSIELLDEMAQELENGDTEEAVAIAADVKQNLEKINYHGKRADGIVKGMLQHSRASNGQKEPTDINILADEYFRLAYHGLRAKDKSFNAELVTHFEQNLPKASIIPQDVGRVLLNLFTNAFYATQQKKSQTTDVSYTPIVEVSTLTKGDTIEITVKDNGTGIPDAIKDKILQPFFTTKPTGEGTGLGLSLSYDIVVKGHGGTIAIDSLEGIFTTFTITLPI